ncbi:MAG: hypothetical protein EBR33_07585 [Synechococcaceae bacterium WB4_1_0192]|nr:hypothetical protein [Synechococcaceae bacterium WB4_1_0192]
MPCWRCGVWRWWRRAHDPRLVASVLRHAVGGAPGSVAPAARGPGHAGRSRGGGQPAPAAAAGRCGRTRPGAAGAGGQRRG